jgi:hypothetical protein
VHFRSWIDEESETGEKNTKVEDSYAYASGAEFILGQGEVPKYASLLLF